MKIALIYLGRRGAGLPISRELARQLEKTDQVLAVLSQAAATGANWDELNAERITTSTYQNTLQAAWSWIEGSRIRNLAMQIAAWKPDVLLFPMFYTWNPFLQIRLRQVPSVVAVHDPQPHPGLSDRLFQWMENSSIRQATRCLVFSQSLVPALTKRGCPPDRIDTINLGVLSYAGIPSQALEPPGRETPGIPTFLFFGRITAYKGLDILLAAFQQVRQRHPARLLVAGDGSLRPYRGLTAALAGVEVINRWIPDEEIPAIFQQADIVVLPYTSASQSGVIPIAAQYSLPVIATRTGGIPEQITDGESGLLVEAGSVEQLRGAMERLLVDPALGRQLGQQLQHDFQDKFSWQQTAAKVRACLAKACDLIT